MEKVCSTNLCYQTANLIRAGLKKTKCLRLPKSLIQTRIVMKICMTEGNGCFGVECSTKL